MNNEEKPQKKHPILKALLIILLVFIAVVGIGAIYLFSRYKKYSVELQEAQKGVIGTEAPDFTVQRSFPCPEIPMRRWRMSPLTKKTTD